MPFDFFALKLPKLTVDQKVLFETGGANPHAISVLVDEFDKEKSPFYSGLKPFDVPEQDKKEIYKDLGDYLLSEYEKNRSDRSGRSKWSHSEQREVLEAAIRFYLRISGENEKFPDLDLQTGKAYLHRSRIIKPKGFTIPAKKEETLKNARQYFQKSSSPLASHYEAVTALEMDRCDLNHLISKEELQKVLRKAANCDISKYDRDQLIEYLQICVRLEELHPGEFGAELVKKCEPVPGDEAELEKLKVLVYTESSKVKGKDISSYRQDLLKKLKNIPLSHPRWEDTVRFLRRVFRMCMKKTAFSAKTVEKLQNFWKDFSLDLWETAEDISRQISSLHLRWYWSRQRDLYDMAFLAALEKQKFDKAAEIADSAKSRPALTWQAMEQMGESKNEAGIKLKECIEQYAIALSGGYIDMKKGENPCMAQTGTEKPIIPPNTDENTIIVQFYLVHLKADEKKDHPKDEKWGYALICDKNGWSCVHSFNFDPLWQSYLKWQNAYFDLPAGSRWESAPLLKELCKEMGKQFSFLFDLAEEDSNKNLLIIPHDFLHRVPVHGALQNNRLLMNCFSCTYMTALHCFKTADETISFSANPPVLIQYFDESKDKDKIGRTKFFMKKGEFDTDKSILLASSDDFCNAFEHEASFFAIRCHGIADTVNPFSSGLKFKNRLSLLELSKQPEEKFFHKRIFIGACETDLIPPTDSPLDEHLSIASILLGKGTASIIGTMWEALDDRIIDMLRDKNLFDSFQNILKKKLKDQADPDSRLLYDNLCFKYYGRK